MSNMSEDIQCAGSDTRPPMLDRTDFESWQQLSDVIAAETEDAFDSDVDEAPNVQTMSMVNLSSEDPIYYEAGLSHDSNTPFE
ncbi:hypothetical protein Tco_0113783, partial [Tanacetum coccineum]